MSTNTLETAYANGEIIDASHVNELTLALLGQFVGRDANGVPTPGQSLGTLAIPWGNMYANGLILNGLAVDTSQITSLPNRVVSGQTRSLSSLSDFLRANGAALEFDILGASVDLVLSINNTAVSISSDLNKTGVVAAPSTNNTAQINDTTISSDLYVGEDGTTITIDTVGSEISSRVGQVAAFETPTGEIFQGFIKSATEITNVYRGFYFDSSGNPLARGVLSNNDVITLLNIGWVFVEDNGTTVDVSYTTPSISYNAPTGPATGDYWFDISNQVWKRYSGTSWDIINRILIGQVVSDATNTVASRSYDFSNQYRDENNMELERFSSEIMKAKDEKAKVSVYGTEIQIDISKLSWNITTDLEGALIEASSTLYYLYLSDQGQEIISDEKPYFRPDLKGHYHPHHSYRCLGFVYNDASSDFTAFDDAGFNPNQKDKELVVKDVKAAGTNGGTFTQGVWQIRDLNTVDSEFDYANLVTNQVLLLPGLYDAFWDAQGRRVNGHISRLRDITNSLTLITGSSAYSGSGGGAESSFGSGTFRISKPTLIELQHACGFTANNTGYGQAADLSVGGGLVEEERYAQVTFTRNYFN